MVSIRVLLKVPPVLDHMQPVDAGAVPRAGHGRRPGGQVRVELGQAAERAADLRVEPAAGRGARLLHPGRRAALPQVQEEPGPTRAGHRGAGRVRRERER